MAIVRKRLSELGSAKFPKDFKMPTEEQIEKWAEEDGAAGFEFSQFRLVRNVNVRALRERLGLTQQEFARRYRFPLRSVQEWEQGRKRPASGTMTLLLAISRDPKALAKALS
ncbi:MAG TPA: helix-turn-helix domain-containing protein [Candidatus Aquilonibacter sp.]|nr:helix-turn-helix domain-containing protein [Candidatus Aquilonibacter sp.]